jgi:hypothetical protein
MIKVLLSHFGEAQYLSKDLTRELLHSCLSTGNTPKRSSCRCQRFLSCSCESLTPSALHLGLRN